MGVESDPAYQAYMRALGFNEGTAQTEAQRQVDKIGTQQAYVLPEIAYQGGVARTNIGLGMEDRGLYRSGETDTNLAQQRHSEQYRTGLVHMQGAESVADIQAGLAQQLADIRRQKNEALIAAGIRANTPSSASGADYSFLAGLG